MAGNFAPHSTIAAFAALVAAVTTFSATEADAGGDKSYVSVALTRTEMESQEDSAKGKDAITIINFTGAWVQAGGLSLGLKYFNFNENGDSFADGGVTTSGYGPMVGYYHASGFFANLSYLYKPAKKFVDRNSHVEFGGGDGYILDVGKVFEMGAWGAALQLTYSKITYKDMNDGTTSTPLKGTWYDGSTFPYIALFVYI